MKEKEEEGLKRRFSWKRQAPVAPQQPQEASNVESQHWVGRARQIPSSLWPAPDQSEAPSQKEVDSALGTTPKAVF